MSIKMETPHIIVWSDLETILPYFIIIMVIVLINNLFELCQKMDPHLRTRTNRARCAHMFLKCSRIALFVFPGEH